MARSKKPTRVPRKARPARARLTAANAFPQGALERRWTRHCGGVTRLPEVAAARTGKAGKKPVPGIFGGKAPGDGWPAFTAACIGCGRPALGRDDGGIGWRTPCAHNPRCMECHASEVEAFAAAIGMTVQIDRVPIAPEEYEPGDPARDPNAPVQYDVTIGRPHFPAPECLRPDRPFEVWRRRFEACLAAADDRLGIGPAWELENPAAGDAVRAAMGKAPAFPTDYGTVYDDGTTVFLRYNRKGRIDACIDRLNNAHRIGGDPEAEDLQAILVREGATAVFYEADGDRYDAASAQELADRSAAGEWVACVR